MTTTVNAASHPALPKFFTCTDIAARFGVTLAAVSNWRRRFGPDSPTPFPAPEEGHPTPVWGWDRWPEIDAWQVRRGGSRRGRRSGAGRRTDREYLTVKDIADLLNVTPGAVRRWRRTAWSLPFPQPDKEITQKTRTVSLWRAERLPDIQWWREWHLNHLARRSQRHGIKDSAPQASAPGALPPSAFLKPARSTSRSGVRQGRVVRPSVRRSLR